jgi:hypothetical protein
VIGTHEVLVYPQGDAPAGTPEDITCLIDGVSIQHGRTDTTAQPEPAAATLDFTVGPGAPLPAVVDMGAWVKVVTHLAGEDSTRFVGRVTDLAIGWEDAGADTPEAGAGQLVAVAGLADYGRRVIGDAPFPAELDGARVARVFDVAGLVLDPAFSDPGTVQVVSRDVDRQPALEVARATADSAGGLIWHTRDGLIRYADAEHRRGTTIALDLDVCDVLVTPTWLRNLDGLVNEVSMTYGVAVDGGERPNHHAVNTTSQARYGVYDYSVTVELAALSDAVAATSLILTQNGTPVWMLQELPVDVAGLTAAETHTLLGLEVHSLVRVGGLPETGQTPTSIAAWVEGWTERLAWGVHELTLAVSDYCRTTPPARWNDLDSSMTWDTAPGIWDTAGCIGAPSPNLGTWDTVPASVRWDQVDPALAWDQAGGGVTSALVAAGASA